MKCVSMVDKPTARADLADMVKADVVVLAGESGEEPGLRVLAGLDVVCLMEGGQQVSVVAGSHRGRRLSMGGFLLSWDGWGHDGQGGSE
ncbi:hypothetical protein Dimus_003368, partial [Dionaea muscipula]